MNLLIYSLFLSPFLNFCVSFLLCFCPPSILYCAYDSNNKYYNKLPYEARPLWALNENLLVLYQRCQITVGGAPPPFAPHYDALLFLLSDGITTTPSLFILWSRCSSLHNSDLHFHKCTRHCHEPRAKTQVMSFLVHSLVLTITYVDAVSTQHRLCELKSPASARITTLAKHSKSSTDFQQ